MISVQLVRRPACPPAPRRTPRLTLEHLESRDVPTSLSFLQGYALSDNGNGVFDAGDKPKPGVTIQLRTTTGHVLQTVTTGSDGYYRFDNVAPGSYRIVELTPGYTTVNAQAKTAYSSASVGADKSIHVTVPKEVSVTYQKRLEGVTSAFTLKGGLFNGTTETPDRYNARQHELQLGSGSRIFSFCIDLFHGSPDKYTVAPSATPDSPIPTHNLGRIGYLYNTFGTQKLDKLNGAALQLAIYELLYDKSPDFNSGNFRLLAGTDAGARKLAEDYIAQSAGKDQRATFLNVVGAKPGSLGSQGMLATESYNFLNQPAKSPLVKGDTATIGFWQNPNGQALILALNGSSSATNLASWLKDTFPNLYGSYPKLNTNADVAALFKQLFGMRGPKVEAQILATALAVYVTDSDLAQNTAARYGFNVSPSGTGAKTFDVGSYGTRIGLKNNTSYTVLTLLQQADAQKKAGTFDALAFNDVFDRINNRGDRG